MVFANMTIFPSSDKLVISMDRFNGMLTTVSCDEDIMLRFNSYESFGYAIRSWNWVNEAKERSFILVTNQNSCGEGRAPYLVSGVHHDEPNFTVHLQATKKAWKDVARTFSLDFGMADAFPIPVSNIVANEKRSIACGDGSVDCRDSLLTSAKAPLGGTRE